jgi:hypothetical protein
METFGIKVEHTFTYDDEGEPDWDAAVEDESVWGFYGNDYALMEAESMLATYTEDDSWIEALAKHRAEPTTFDPSLNVRETFDKIEVHLAEARAFLDDEHEGGFKFAVTNLAYNAARLDTFAKGM